MSLLNRIGLGRLSGKLTQLQQALDHETDVTHRRLQEIAEKIEKLSQLQQALDHRIDETNRKVDKIAEKVDSQFNLLLRRFEELAGIGVQYVIVWPASEDYDLLNFLAKDIVPSFGG